MARGRNDDDLFLDDLADDLLGDSGSGDDDVQAPAANNTTEDFFEDVNEVPGQLAVDVYQTKDHVVVRAMVAGVQKGDIDLSLVENTLTIRGSRHTEQTVQEGDYFAQELHWGEFSRSIVLPAQVKEEGAEAELKDGVLTVKIPKAEQDKVKKISIQ